MRHLLRKYLEAAAAGTTPGRVPRRPHWACATPRRKALPLLPLPFASRHRGWSPVACCACLCVDSKSVINVIYHGNHLRGDPQVDRYVKTTYTMRRLEVEFSSIECSRVRKGMRAARRSLTPSGPLLVFCSVPPKTFGAETKQEKA